MRSCETCRWHEFAYKKHFCRCPRAKRPDASSMDRRCAGQRLNWLWGLGMLFDLLDGRTCGVLGRFWERKT